MKWLQRQNNSFMKIKILVGMIILLGVFLVASIYENLSLKAKIREMSDEQEITSQKINQLNSVVNYLLQNNNLKAKSVEVPVNFELAGNPQEISYSTPTLDEGLSRFEYTHSFHNYEAQVSFYYQSTSAYEVNPNVSSFQMFITEEPYYPSFHVGMNSDDYCYHGYCAVKKIDTFKTAHHEWDYLGYIKASDVGVPSDELLEQYVFTTKIGDAVVYMESGSDPREKPNHTAYTIFDSFNIEIK